MNLSKRWENKIFLNSFYLINYFVLPFYYIYLYLRLGIVLIIKFVYNLFMVWKTKFTLFTNVKDREIFEFKKKKTDNQS